MADIGQKLYKQQNLDESKILRALLEEARLSRDPDNQFNIREGGVTPELASQRTYAMDDKLAGLISPEGYARAYGSEEWGTEDAKMQQDERRIQLENIDSENKAKESKFQKLKSLLGR